MSLSVQIVNGPVQLSGNPAEIIVSGGDQPAGTIDYKLLLKVISQDGKLDGAPLIDAITPDENGSATFNISGYVDQPVDASFQFPVSAPVVSYPSRAFKVQVQPGESYIENGILVETWGAVSNVLQFLKGGNHPRTISLWNAASTNFYQQYIEKGRFLTPRPWGEFVIPGQPVKLWFMVTEGRSAVFHINLVYRDMTQAGYSWPVSLSADSLYEFNCNPLLLGMDALSGNGSKVFYFDVWLESGGMTISDSRRFHYDNRYFERTFFLFYTNSMGGIDDAFFGGHAIESVSTENTVVFKPPHRNNSIFNSTLIVANKEGKNTWQLNSGYRPTSQVPDYRDLVVARQVWMVYPNRTNTGYLLTPVVIENSEVDLVNHKERLTEITLEVSEAHLLRFGFDGRITY